VAAQCRAAEADRRIVRPRDRKLSERANCYVLAKLARVHRSNQNDEDEGNPCRAKDASHTAGIVFSDVAQDDGSAKEP
jgi:hypothetical protein